MLDVNDMVDCIKPDERSVMTYVAAYYKAFASSNKVGLRLDLGWSSCVGQCVGLAGHGS